MNLAADVIPESAQVAQETALARAQAASDAFFLHQHPRTVGAGANDPARTFIATHRRVRLPVDVFEDEEVLLVG